MDTAAGKGGLEWRVWCEAAGVKGQRGPLSPAPGFYGRCRKHTQVLTFILTAR